LAPPQRLVGSTRPEANASAARMIVSEMLLSGETPVSSRLTRTDAGNDVVRFQSAAGATVLATTRERLISKFRSLESWHIPGAGFVQIVAQRMTPLENMGLFMRSVVVPLAEAWFPILTIALGPTLPVLAMNAFVFALIHRKHIAPRTAGAFIILALSSQLASPGWVFLGTTVVLHGVWNAVVPREWRLQIIEKPEVKSLVKEAQREKIAELVTKQIQENRSRWMLLGSIVAAAGLFVYAAPDLTALFINATNLTTAVASGHGLVLYGAQVTFFSVATALIVIEVTYRTMNGARRWLLKEKDKTLDLFSTQDEWRAAIQDRFAYGNYAITDENLNGLSTTCLRSRTS
jgi:hypothetical protein